MRILLINQPNNNRGDEAAHRSLMRTLNQNFSEVHIEVVFTNTDTGSVNQMRVENPNNTYTLINTFKTGRMLARYLAFKFGLVKLSAFHPAHFKVSMLIKKADLILCAPGGISMGLFQNWEHIYWLLLAKTYKKRIAYYSRSFGPFPEETSKNKLFKRISYSLLNYFDFISIRDSRTMRMADQMNLKYVPSIDTAFLDVPVVSIPSELDELIQERDYAVFVPNRLTWHPAFKSCSLSQIDALYVKILEDILISGKISKIILLPQQFNVPGGGDFFYFNKLQSKVSDKRIIVISDKYGSDIQQWIIGNSKLMIGVRYHSIVFAINNNVPFVALSYEHKISGLLKLLGLEALMVNIEKIGETGIDINKISQEVISKINLKIDLKQYQKKAKLIAIECMNQFSEKIIKDSEV